MSAGTKVWITIADPHDGDGIAARRIYWYTGTSDAHVAAAVRLQLHLPRDAEFLLRDADGDLVPIASTLPHMQHFRLVRSKHVTAALAQSPRSTRSSDVAPNTPQSTRSIMLEHTPGLGLDATPAGLATSPSMTQSTQPSTTTSTLHAELEPQQQQQTSPHKRRRVTLGAATAADAHERDASTDDLSIASLLNHPSLTSYSTTGQSTPSPTPLPQPTHSLASMRLRAGSISLIVTQFLDAFTAPIENDDNVNFIPNTGTYALYGLYSAIVRDRALHPKGQDAFYKMTSLQGKVDRQRVVRYYCDTHATTGHIAFVQYRPQGKGPLLRKYAAAATPQDVQALIARAESIAQLLQQSREHVVATYVAFVKGFLPVSKTTYQMHQYSRRAGAP